MTAAVTRGSFSSHSEIVTSEWIEFADAASQCRSLRGRLEIFSDRLPTDFQMAFNLANRPSLGPVEPVQVVDLIGGEHCLSPFMQQARRRDQKDVVCKRAAREPGRAEVFQSPRSGRKLSCCLQDPSHRGRPAKPVRRNVLGPELRCCLQAGTAAVSRRGPSAAPGFGAWRLGAPPGIASSSRDSRRATCASCPGKPGGIPDRRRSFLCGIPCAVAAGNRPRYKPSAAAETWTVGSSSDNSGNAVLPSCRCRIGIPNRRQPDLETAVECLPRPRQWSRPATSPGKVRLF